MPQVLAQFDEPVVSQDGKRYRAQACGAAMSDGLWEGWIEFVPLEVDEEPLRSPRETTQPNRVDTLYWAGGLTATYLEGAFERAQRASSVKPARPSNVKTTGPAPAQPVFNAPAAESKVIPSVPARAVLDPFSVYEKGEALLRQELRALSSWHLVNIIVDYDLSEQPYLALNSVPQATLIDLIVTAVRERIANLSQAEGSRRSRQRSVIP